MEEETLIESGSY